MFTFRKQIFTTISKYDTKSILKNKVEPSLSKIFRIEHLSLIISKGLTNVINVNTQDFGRITLEDNLSIKN